MDVGFKTNDPPRGLRASESAHPDPAVTFEQALAAEQAPLRAFLSRISASRRSDVDDLAQESLTRALHYRDRFDMARPLWPWLKQIALRVFLDERPTTTRPFVTQLDAVEQQVASPQGTPALRETVSHLLSRLTPVERDVLVRFHQHGESVRLIASTLALPEGTVKSHLHRARRRLASEANEEMNP